MTNIHWDVNLLQSDEDVSGLVRVECIKLCRHFGVVGVVDHIDAMLRAFTFSRQEPTQSSEARVSASQIAVVRDKDPKRRIIMDRRSYIIRLILHFRDCSEYYQFLPDITRDQIAKLKNYYFRMFVVPHWRKRN